MPGLHVVFVGRLIPAPAGVAGQDLQNARHFFEIALHAPEAAAGKSGRPDLRIRLHRLLFHLPLFAASRSAAQGQERHYYRHHRFFHDCHRSKLHPLFQW